MATTIAANKVVLTPVGQARWKDYPNCRFEGTDVTGRPLVWEMRRTFKRDGVTPSHWKFFAPTVEGYRLKEIGMHECQFVQYLFASDEELGEATKLEVLEGLRKAYPHRKLVDALPMAVEAEA